MNIHRDKIGGAYPSMQKIVQNAMTMSDSEEPVKPLLYVPIKTEPATAAAVPRTIPPPPSPKVAYALNPIQNHIAMQKGAFEKERKVLLRKASNFGGESSERIIGDYLAI